MKFSMTEFNRAKTRMASAINAAITESEHLLKASAAASGGRFAPGRTTLEEKSGSAQASLADAFGSGVPNARQATAAGDEQPVEGP
jgi:hypothetical protein